MLPMLSGIFIGMGLGLSVIVTTVLVVERVGSRSDS